MDMQRPPVFADRFYPSDPEILGRFVDSQINQFAESDRNEQDPPAKALIVPHSEYLRSGKVAAAAYATLRNRQPAITRVVLIGQTVRTWIDGIVGPELETFSGPLGDVEIDQDALASLVAKGLISHQNRPHLEEHVLEVQLPFLSRILGHKFRVVPLLAGATCTNDIAAVLRELWGGPETLIVVSSDLSQYLPYDLAQRRDAATAVAIERLQADGLTVADAVGFHAISALVRLIREGGGKLVRRSLMNSGDAEGSRTAVTGFGAWEGSLQTKQ